MIASERHYASPWAGRRIQFQRAYEKLVQHLVKSAAARETVSATGRHPIGRVGAGGAQLPAQRLAMEAGHDRVFFAVTDPHLRGG